MVSVFARKANVADVCLSPLIGISTRSFAQESLQAPPLGLQDAIVRSLHSNPDLEAFAYELEAQLGRVGEQTLAAVQARVRSTKAAPTKEALAYAQLPQLRVLREEFDHGLVIARQQMAALCGERNPGFGAAQGSLLTPPTLQAYEVFVGRLERNRALLEASTDAHRVRLEIERLTGAAMSGGL